MLCCTKGEVFEPCERGLLEETDFKAISQPALAGLEKNEERPHVRGYSYTMKKVGLLISKYLEKTPGYSHDLANCSDRYAYL